MRLSPAPEILPFVVLVNVFRAGGRSSEPATYSPMTRRFTPNVTVCHDAEDRNKMWFYMEES